MLRRPVYLKTKDSAPLKGQTQDVSQGGLCILLEVKLDQGMECDVTFDVPNGGSEYRVEATISVVHAYFAGMAGFRIGCSFTRISDKDRELLNGYVNALPAGLLQET